MAIEAPPFRVMTLAEEAVKVPVEVRAPATEKLVVVVVVPVAIVKLLKTRLVVAPPLLTILPPVIVIVPAVGAKVMPESTVRAPVTPKLVVG